MPFPVSLKEDVPHCRGVPGPGSESICTVYAFVFVSRVYLVITLTEQGPCLSLFTIESPEPNILFGATSLSTVLNEWLNTPTESQMRGTDYTVWSRYRPIVKIIFLVSEQQFLPNVFFQPNIYILQTHKVRRKRFPGSWVIFCQSSNTGPLSVKGLAKMTARKPET